MVKTERATTDSGTLAVGYLAALITTVSQLPQVLKVRRSNHVRDLSLEFYVMLFVGVIMWIVYGALQSDLVIVVANSFTLFFTGYIALKIVIKRRPSR